ncbi:Exostosin-like protein [Cynara cardunculus var. scolymus]|uniref:Exostosin-like protein n=1 Tax=Cynara cardunculus var. scolymus TaxID=59895 RepID=A0A103XNN0_CYNCS|nr:Exostosin-like protein [Cynara cardunculus var. scolymus]
METGRPLQRLCRVKIQRLLVLVISLVVVFVVVAQLIAFPYKNYALIVSPLNKGVLVHDVAIYDNASITFELALNDSKVEAGCKGYDCDHGSLVSQIAAKQNGSDQTVSVASESTRLSYMISEGKKPIFHDPKLRGIYASEGWFMKLIEKSRNFITKDPRKAHLFYLPFSSLKLRNSSQEQHPRNRKDLEQHLKNYVDLIAGKYPFWNRTNGADHFLVACHDWAMKLTKDPMGSCIRSLCNSNLAGGFKIGKDTTLPATYIRSAEDPVKDLGGNPPSERPILAFFAGGMHGNLRPILIQHWHDKDPDMKIFGPMARDIESKASYRTYMKSSKYCICARGYEVFSPRIVESIYFECVPVIISDNYVPPFFEFLDWGAFSVFVLEKDVANLSDILRSISGEKYLEMQKKVKMVQQHFIWHKKPNEEIPNSISNCSSDSEETKMAFNGDLSNNLGDGGSVNGGITIENVASKVVNLGGNGSGVGLRTRILPINEKYALFVSDDRKRMRCLMPPKSVMYKDQMDRLLVRHRRSSRAMRPRWSSARDQDILASKARITSAPSQTRTLKVYVYKDGEKPIFHQPILKGLYASEGWFMKLMEGNKQFVVKDPRKAHLFYMPFSARMLEHTLYVPLCNADVTAGFKIGRDVSLPECYVRSARNPLRDLGGKPASERHIFAFYAGNMHGYLRKILLEYWNNKDADMKISGPMPPGVASKMNYIEHMKSSKYCICPKGYEVNSPRVVESIFYECVPVIISDNFVPPFFEVLDWEAFSVIVAEKDIPELKKILAAITDERYRELQNGVKKVQKHFLWHVKPQKYDLFHMILHSIWYNRVFQIKPR